MFYWFVQITVHFLAKVLFRLQVEGLENIPGRGNFILASNHRSHLDPPILAVSISRKLHFMAKMELFEDRFFGQVLRNLNCIKLNRDSIDRTALKEGLKALHHGEGLAVFPEGKRSADGRLGSGKAGVALFAFGEDAPVIPTFIRGSERAMSPGKHFIRPTKIRVTFGKRLIPPKIINRADKKSAYQKFTDRVMREIASLEKEAA